MLKKYYFLIFATWTCSITASHHPERIQDTQEIPAPQASWFKIKKISDRYRQIIITCHQKENNHNLPEHVVFHQNESGHLIARFNNQVQNLRHFPDKTLKTEETMTEWYYDTEKTVRILIPYSPQRLKKPS